MFSDLPDHELALRLGAFGAVLAVLAAWEAFAPRRRQAIARGRRWPANLGVAILSAVAVRLLFPVAAVAVALIAEQRGWGLLGWIDLAPWVEVVIAFVALDLLIYAQHVLFHRLPALWRLHRMHHSDLELDVTTGVRFHPLEIVLSMLIKIGAVALIGAPAAAVLIFEVVLNAASMFNHANIGLGARTEPLLRLMLVTPEMHQVHHSIVRPETDSNFGFCLPWWDRLFGTYRDRPEAGLAAMTIGLAAFRELDELRLDRMLVQPLKRDRPSGSGT